MKSVDYSPGLTDLSTSSSRSSTALKLNYDVLLNVVSVGIDQAKDAVSLIGTCRLLYREGPKIALRKPVNICGEEELALFVDFLRADNLTRCPYLRRLSLWACHPDDDDDLAHRLAETLPLLTGLAYLELGEAEELLQCDPALPLAFVALTSLHHIRVTGADGETCQLLSAIQSPLVSADVSFLGDRDDTLWALVDARYWASYHPVTVFAGHADTLEELQCKCWYTPSDEDVIPEAIYPSMRKLSIVLHDVPLLMAPFIRAFPNLTDLHVLTEDDGDVDAPHHMERMRASHRVNVARQSRARCAWERLEHFSGRLTDLYSIGLISHIRRVTIVDPLDKWPKLDMLAEALRCARPLHLKLHRVTGTLLGDPDRGVVAMLRDRGVSNLITFDMQVHFGEGDREKDLKIVLEDLTSALARLPLKCLELAFYTSGLVPTAEDLRDFDRQGDPRPIVAPLSPAECSLSSVNVDGLVALLTDRVSSLSNLLLVLHNSRAEGETVQGKMTKGKSPGPGHGQWESWMLGKNDESV